MIDCFRKLKNSPFFLLIQNSNYFFFIIVFILIHQSMHFFIPNFYQGQPNTWQKKTKKEKLLEAKSVYICECSKIYLSFPALYLHVKNKHNVKLTSRIDEESCTIEEKNGASYFTFFYSTSTEKRKDSVNLNFPKRLQSQEFYQKQSSQRLDRSESIKFEESEVFEEIRQSEKQKSSLDHQNYESLIQLYIQSPKAVISEFFEASKVVLLNFIEYVERSALISEQFQRMKESQPRILVQSLPLLFNQYVCYYLPQYLWDQNYQAVRKDKQIQVMKMFGNWLREQSLTNLFVLDNL